MKRIPLFVVLAALVMQGCSASVAPDGAASDFWPGERKSEASRPVEPSAVELGGPIDTIRQAGEVVREARALLDAAKREGKVTIDVRLPRTLPQAGAACGGGVCFEVPPATAGVSAVGKSQRPCVRVSSRRGFLFRRTGRR